MIKTNKGKEILISPEDYELVSQYNWYEKKSKNTSYAQANYKKDTKWIKITMHRLIMGFPDKQVDHANHNGLDNRRENLRLCTHSQNMMNMNQKRNRLGIKGIIKNDKKFQVRVSVNNIRRTFGSYWTLEDAVKVYDSCLHYLHKEFAMTNSKEILSKEELITMYIESNLYTNASENSYIGIQVRSNGYSARASFDSKRYKLGVFQTYEDAIKSLLNFKVPRLKKEAELLFTFQDKE